MDLFSRLRNWMISWVISLWTPIYQPYTFQTRPHSFKIWFYIAWDVFWCNFHLLNLFWSTNALDLIGRKQGYSHKLTEKNPNISQLAYFSFNMDKNYIFLYNLFIWIQIFGHFLVFLLHRRNKCDKTKFYEELRLHNLILSFTWL